jgi:hypothetical protein
VTAGPFFRWFAQSRSRYAAEGSSSYGHHRLPSTSAVLAHERGDYFSAAQHYEDAAECYLKPEEGDACRQLAKEELFRHQTMAKNRVPA